MSNELNPTFVPLGRMGHDDVETLIDCVNMRICMIETGTAGWRANEANKHNDVKANPLSSDQMRFVLRLEGMARHLSHLLQRSS